MAARPGLHAVANKTKTKKKGTSGPRNPRLAGARPQLGFGRPGFSPQAIYDGFAESRRLYGPDMKPGTADDPKGPNRTAVAPSYSPGAPATQPTAINPMALIAGAAHTQANTDIGLANKTYEITKGTLDRQFFDPTNEFSEASQIANAAQIMDRGAMNDAARTGQIYSGSYLNQLGYNAEDTRKATYDSSERYKALLGQAGQTRDQAISEANWRANSADFTAAQWAADHPDATTPGRPAVPLGMKPPDPSKGTMYGRGNPFVDKTIDRAVFMFAAGNRSGKDWRPIIDFLGYDPRRGGQLVFK